MENKHRVFLFGSRSRVTIPSEVLSHLEAIMQKTNGNVEFIVGDAPGIDAAFHKALSSIGAASNTTVYCMEEPRNNRYDLKTKAFISSYNPDTLEVSVAAEGEQPDIITGVKKIEDVKFDRNYYGIKDRKMINDCTFAICVWDRESRGTFTNVNILHAQDKYVFVYQV